MTFRGPGATQRQAAALRRERVVVHTGSMGELSINLAVYGWFPSCLPSEEVESSSSDEAQEEEEGAT